VARSAEGGVVGTKPGELAMRAYRTSSIYIEGDAAGDEETPLIRVQIGYDRRCCYENLTIPEALMLIKALTREIAVAQRRATKWSARSRRRR